MPGTVCSSPSAAGLIPEATLQADSAVQERGRAHSVGLLVREVEEARAAVTPEMRAENRSRAQGRRRSFGRGYVNPAHRQLWSHFCNFGGICLDIADA